MSQLALPRSSEVTAAYRIIDGDCLTVVPAEIAAASIDLVFTSPPYADQRRKNYGGIHPGRLCGMVPGRAPPSCARR